jgi:hypothetical protein
MRQKEQNGYYIIKGGGGMEKESQTEIDIHVKGIRKTKDIYSYCMYTTIEVR